MKKDRYDRCSSNSLTFAQFCQQMQQNNLQHTHDETAASKSDEKTQTNQKNFFNGMKAKTKAIQTFTKLNKTLTKQ